MMQPHPDAPPFEAGTRVRFQQGDVAGEGVFLAHTWKTADNYVVEDDQGQRWYLVPGVDVMEPVSSGGS